MLDGQIQSLVAEKGFGFIKPSAGGADVFFHYLIVDAPLETLVKGQPVKYELDLQAEKPRALCVKTGAVAGSGRAAQSTARPRSAPSGRPREARRPVVRQSPEYGFVTKLHRKKLQGFISSVKHGPEYLFAAASVTGEKRFSRLEIGDYVQFFVDVPDPAEPKQPVAKDVMVVEREQPLAREQRLDRHPNARGKKPTWR